MKKLKTIYNVFDLNNQPPTVKIKSLETARGIRVNTGDEKYDSVECYVRDEAGKLYKLQVDTSNKKYFDILLKGMKRGKYIAEIQLCYGDELIKSNQIIIEVVESIIEGEFEALESVNLHEIMENLKTLSESETLKKINNSVSLKDLQTAERRINEYVKVCFNDINNTLMSARFEYFDSFQPKGNYLTNENYNSVRRELSNFTVTPGLGVSGSQIHFDICPELTDKNKGFLMSVAPWHNFSLYDIKLQKTTYELNGEIATYYLPLSMSGQAIKNLKAPENDTDGANKKYVDDKIKELEKKIEALSK